ncbi:MAG: molybdopterin-guanine dinucleotide biosynthesis protein B [Candidatus Thorarchaeota archaeon]
MIFSSRLSVVIIRIIDVIGYSGSGKTFFIMSALKLLKRKFDYNITVIKNVKHHQIDDKGKDSRLFTESGASYSIIQNLNKDMAIFLNLKEVRLDDFIKWLTQGPYEIGIIFTEGFRNLNHPTVLCASNVDEIKPQLTDNVKMISGIICGKGVNKRSILDIPIINIEQNFQTFLEIFEII